MPSIFVQPQRLFKPFKQEQFSFDFRRFAPIRLRLPKTRRKPDLDMLTQRIILPSLPMADEDVARLSHWETGRMLARQELWDELSDLLNTADDARLTTPGGADEASLLAMGAQSDIAAAAREALEDGQAPDPAAIAQLEEVLISAPDTHAFAVVVAMAHLNIGDAWKATTQPIEGTGAIPHYRRAREILSRFNAIELDSPSLAALQCRLVEACDAELSTLIDAYHRLLALDPLSPVHLRSFGAALARAAGDDKDLFEAEACKIAAEARQSWGEGAYSLIYLDILVQCPSALATVDADRFIQGLRDILRARPNQHITNELSAFCALSMAPPPDASLPPNAAQTQARLHGCLDWILSDYLQELHPMIWARAEHPSSVAPRISSTRKMVAEGRKTALRIIAQRFTDQLADGSTIAFSPAGMYRLPAM